MNPLFGVAIILFGHQPRPKITDSFVVPSAVMICTRQAPDLGVDLRSCAVV
jgi:hypothetical protein